MWPATVMVMNRHPPKSYKWGMLQIKNTNQNVFAKDLLLCKVRHATVDVFQISLVD